MGGVGWLGMSEVEAPAPAGQTVVDPKKNKGDHKLFGLAPTDGSVIWQRSFSYRAEAVVGGDGIVVADTELGVFRCSFHWIRFVAADRRRAR